MARGEIKVDGKLDEADWGRAPVQELTQQKLPRTGAPVSAPTRWQALFSEHALYIGIRCESKPGVEVVARRTRRDRTVESDRVTIDIDSRGQRIDAFHFEVTAGGSVVDGIRYSDTNIDVLWDAVWSAAVTTDEGGWTVEVEIPLPVLRRAASATEPIGIQVRRYTNDLGELDEWAPTPRDGSREVSAYGHLLGAEMPRRRASLELLPYVAIGPRIETGPEAVSDLLGRGGLDLKLRLGSDTTIDATALPDFGNVEADTAVLHLETTEVRFPEKRPFFLEGLDVFYSPLGLFYTRRIGSLAGTTAGNARGRATPARVLAAGKVVARLSPRWTLASLAAVTQAQDVVVTDEESGITAKQRVLPGFVYGVIRAKYNLPHSGYIGAMATTRMSFDRGPLAPWTSCPNGHMPVRGTCFADVYAVSADARIRSADGAWVGTGQILGTFHRGGTPQRSIDGNVIEDGDEGGAALVSVEKKAGRIIGELRYEWQGRDADWNATGFLAQPNRHFTRGELGLQTLRPHGPVLEDRLLFVVYQRFTLAGLPNGSGYQLSYKARWRNFWRTLTEVHIRPSYYDIRDLRDGTPLQRPGLFGIEHSVATDSRKPLSVEVAGVWQARRDAGHHLDGAIDVDWNVRSAVQLRLGLSGTFDRGEIRWAKTDRDAGVYRLARLDARALGVLLRVNYTITPKLELQAYAQLFGVGTTYAEGFVAPLSSPVLLDGLTPDPSMRPIRRTEALLAANLFFRWEYAPGSNLWLIFSRTQPDVRDPDGTGRVSFHSLDRLPAAYLIMAKVTMLLGGDKLRRKR
ncbi:MAG TPA: DUF5916 domain-containing protein [Nannocystis sp.]